MCADVTCCPSLPLQIVLPDVAAAPAGSSKRGQRLQRVTLTDLGAGHISYRGAEQPRGTRWRGSPPLLKPTLQLPSRVRHRGRAAASRHKSVSFLLDISRPSNCFLLHPSTITNSLLYHPRASIEPNAESTPLAPSTMASSFFSLEGQTALVTGGTRGIGQAVAIGLAEAGADVLLVQVSFTRALNSTPC